MEKTYLEKLTEEVIRPMVGAAQVLLDEITETMQIPNAPWKILNKSYDKLTEQEIQALLDIYHTEGEETPCPMCDWMARTELQRLHKEEKVLGG